MSDKIFISYFCAFLSLISYFTDGAITPHETRFIGNRIVGGNDTTIEKWPFIVQFLYEMDHFCGGSLLTPRKALSAAHCFDHDFPSMPDLPEGLFHVRAGSTTLGEGGVVSPVIKAILHENFNKIIFADYDIAVILIKDSLPLGDAINLAKLPAFGSAVPDNATVTYVGWGLTTADDDAVLAKTLQEVNVFKVNTDVCQEGYREIEKQILEEEGRAINYTLTDNMMCAGLMGVGGKDACTADSGGPLVHNGTLVGVISWGHGCAHPNAMGVSARVANFNIWIDEQMKKLDEAEDKNVEDGASTANLNYILVGILLLSVKIYS